MNRCSGILMPVFSLPSPYGIGTLGKAAYDFADFLHAAGQRCWQMLPLGPTSYGDSPYQSFSTYAGNPYFIDLDMLIEDGLLTRDVAILQFLASQECCFFGDIHEELPIAKATVSQHLKELKEAGLIQGEIEAPKVRYCINKENWKLAKKMFADFLGQPICKKESCCE